MIACIIEKPVTERKLATIRKIDQVNPIEGADAIEVCTIGGWKVVSQKGLYKEGDLAIYCEVDSFIPTTIAPFLTKSGHFPKQFNQIEGERLKTIRLRGQISQGLLLPLSLISNGESYGVPFILRDGEDITEFLGIQKWEAPIPAQLAGSIKGSFPSFLQKTDQERIQNLKAELVNWVQANATWEVTEKLDGSSMTVYVRDGEVGVCSRNLELKENINNTFWKTAIQSGLIDKLANFGQNIAIQGELIGPGIQNNIYGLSSHEFRVYDVFNVDTYEYLTPPLRRELCDKLDLLHVPVLAQRTLLIDNVEALLESAEGQSEMAKKPLGREGLVFKCHEEQISFKAISNVFLLKHGG